MQKNSQIEQFWIESTIKGFRKAIEQNDRDELISVIVDKADRDTMTGARFNKSDYKEKHKKYSEKLKELIKANINDLCSSKLIKGLKKEAGEDVPLGLVQKIVNMSLKYLVAVGSYANTLGICIDEKKCDCPLDSNILHELSKKTHKKYSPWTKINTIDEYKMIQDDIRKLVDTSNLEYDFKNWGE